MRLYKVMNNDLTSPFQGFQFELGKKYVCEDFDNSDRECSRGFYATDFNGLVYSLNKDGEKHSVFEVEVGGKFKEFNQFKRRFEEMTILRQITENEIKAGLSSCEETEGYKVLEACYPVNPLAIEPIPLDEALVLLEQWKKVRKSICASFGASVWTSVWASVRDSVGDSVGAYTSSLFPNVRKWEYIIHAEGVNPFQPCIDLWRGGYVPSFYGNIWRLHTKHGITWEGK